VLWKLGRGKGDLQDLVDCEFPPGTGEDKCNCSFCFKGNFHGLDSNEPHKPSLATL